MSAPPISRAQRPPHPPSSEPPSLRPAARLGRIGMARDAVTVGLSYQNGWFSRIQATDNDVVRFSTGTRHFVALLHPEHIDHVLHAGRLNYYKSYEYELLRAILGVSPFTDEEDSWQRYRTMMTPMFAKRHLNGLVGLMIEPIDALLVELEERDGRIELDMVNEMVEWTLNVVGNALFSQGFGPVAAGMSGKVTGGLRFGERMLRLFLVAAPPAKVWRGLSRVAFTPLPLPPPFWSIQKIVRHIDNAVWKVINDTGPILSPTSSSKCSEPAARPRPGEPPRDDTYERRFIRSRARPVGPALRGRRHRSRKPASLTWSSSMRLTALRRGVAARR